MKSKRTLNYRLFILCNEAIKTTVQKGREVNWVNILEPFRLQLVCPGSLQVCCMMATHSPVKRS